MLKKLETDRSKAIKWWNGLSENEQLFAMRSTEKVIEALHRPLASLTGREIQLIWEQHIKPFI